MILDFIQSKIINVIDSRSLERPQAIRRAPPVTSAAGEIPTAGRMRSALTVIGGLPMYKRLLALT
jgi:hypothetical protein